MPKMYYDMYMSKRYSLSEARSNLPQLVREAERGVAIELTRRGQAVAVMVSLRDYERVKALSPSFWTAIEEFRENHDLADLEIEGVFDNVRDRTIGREVDL